MKVKIDIDTMTLVRFWLVVAGLGLTAYLIYSARTALIIIGAAMFFAIALSPWVNKLAKLFPSKSRALGSVLAYLVVVVILGLIMFLIIPPVIGQSAKVAQTIPNLIDGASEQYKGIASFVQKYSLEEEFNGVILSIKNSATDFASNIGPQIIKSIGSIFSILTSTVLVLVLAFLMLTEGHIWLDIIWRSYRSTELMEKHRRVVKRMYSVVTGYVTGQLTVSTIGATFSGLLVFTLSLFFSIPANIAIPAAAMVFITSLIPMFGATIGAVLVGLVLMLNSFTATLIFIAIFIIYQQVEGNFIIPKVQSNKLDLSALAILASITIGIYLFGIAGGIISIPIAGCVKVLAEEYAKPRIKKV